MACDAEEAGHGKWSVTTCHLVYNTNALCDKYKTFTW